MSSKYQGVKYLLCVTDIFKKHAWVKPLKDRKAKTFLDGFVGIVNESKRKPNKLWVDQGKEIYKSFMQIWLDDNILMYSTHNEGKPVVAERFIRTLKTKIYKKMTTNNSKSYLGYLNKLVNEYNNTYHRSVGKKPIDADFSALTEETESSYKSTKLKVGDRFRITKYKNIFRKGYTEIWSIETFVIDSVLKTNPWVYKIKALNGEAIIGSFHEEFF